MSSLFEINKTIDELTEQLVDVETGEVNEDVLEQLEQLGLDQDAKLESYGMKIKSLNAEIDALVNESKSLKKRADVKSNLVDRLMEMVSRTLNGKPKEYTRVNFGFRKSETVEIVNPELVPDEFCEFETKRKPVKAKIKPLLKAEEDVPGCVLIEKQNLQVK